MAWIMKDNSSLFGRLVKKYGTLGELRRQKKKPHKEILYVRVVSDIIRPLSITTRLINESDAALRGRIEDTVTHTSRAVCNCSNDQLVYAIKRTAQQLTDHVVIQTDAEFILDLLYKELETRV